MDMLVSSQHGLKVSGKNLCERGIRERIKVNYLLVHVGSNPIIVARSHGSLLHHLSRR